MKTYLQLVEEAQRTRIPDEGVLSELKDLAAKICNKLHADLDRVPFGSDPISVRAVTDLLHSACKAGGITQFELLNRETDFDNVNQVVLASCVIGFFPKAAYRVDILVKGGGTVSVYFYVRKPRPTEKV